MKKTTLISESWNKGKEQPDSLKKKLTGTYQKPPFKKLSLDLELSNTVKDEPSEEIGFGYTPDDSDHSYSTPKKTLNIKRPLQEHVDTLEMHPYL